jgi:hypothetical protein
VSHVVVPLPGFRGILSLRDAATALMMMMMMMKMMKMKLTMKTIESVS